MHEPTEVEILRLRIKELEAKLIDVQSPTQRGFIIVGFFNEASYDDQLDWLQVCKDEIDIAYGPVLFSSLIEEGFTIERDHPNGPRIYFDIIDGLDYECE